MRVHLVSPKDNWILEKIASKLMEITDIQLSQSQGIDYEADLNYFINWCYWKILYPKLDKPEKTLIFFTHLDSHSEKYMDVLDRADHIAVMSLHGKEVLLNIGIDYDKIHVIEGFGTIPNLPYRKIKIGIAGKPQKDGRKGEDILIKLAKDLDSDIFEFVFANDSWIEIAHKIDKVNDCAIHWDYETSGEFFKDIDYYFSPSHSEGGPMDMLNAAECGIPIISKDIGFFHELRTAEDITFKDYDDLLWQFQEMEKCRIDKINKMKRHSWDNFKDWHVKLFKEINGS